MSEVLVECRKNLYTLEVYIIHDTFKQWLARKRIPKCVSSSTLEDLVSEFVLYVSKFYRPEAVPIVGAPDDITEIELNNKALNLLRAGADCYCKYAREAIKELASNSIRISKFLHILDAFIVGEIQQRMEHISRL